MTRLEGPLLLTGGKTKQRDRKTHELPV
eukprot:gene27128-biopygen17679